MHEAAPGSPFRFTLASLFDASTRPASCPPNKIGGSGHSSNPSIDAASKFGTDYRLLRADGYAHVLKARSVANKDLKVFFSQNNRTNARLGLIVSKKTLPRAVDRNRAKRVIRETFRCHSIKSRGLDIVVLLKAASALQAGLGHEKLDALFSQINSAG